MGKTFVAMSIAHAVASGGSALRWHAPEPRRVLYVDGEMPASMLQERLRRIVDGAEHQPPADDYLQVLSADLREVGLPNLADEAGQAAIELAAASADLVILDNLSSLARGMRENEADDWGNFQAWLLSLRRAGKSVLLVHHAGKSGQQRGTSRREDVLDTVLALRRPQDYCPEQGARFAVHLEKARGLTGADTAPFEADLIETPNGGLSWTVSDLTTRHQDRARALLAKGLSMRDVAEETGMSKSAVQRLNARMNGNGSDGHH